jgi:hypothetical protein
MPDKWRIAEVFFAGAIAFFTLALSVVSYFQYDAARKAARRAIQANRVAQQALMESEKGFVYVSKIDIQPSDFIKLRPLHVETNAQLVIQLTNSGNTPARAVHCHGNAVWIPTDLDQFAFPDYPIPAYEKAGSTLLAPKQIMDVRFPIPAVVVLSAREHLSALIVYGHIEYRDDVLHASHRTWFCQGFRSEGNDPAVSDGDIFGQCYQHNCSDNDCGKPWNWTFPAGAPMNVSVSVAVPNNLLGTPSPTPTPAGVTTQR